jgi:hypothetical protein
VPKERKGRKAGALAGVMESSEQVDPMTSVIESVEGAWDRETGER